MSFHPTTGVTERRGFAPIRQEDLINEIYDGPETYKISQLESRSVECSYACVVCGSTKKVWDTCKTCNKKICKYCRGEHNCDDEPKNFKLKDKFVLETRGHSDKYGCSAKVHPICEPLKIRNITKGNSLSYALAKGLQLDIHSYMRKLPQFALIGTPLTIDHINWLVKRSPKGEFASGDFSAATDNISIEMTKAFFEVIIDKLILEHQLGKTKVDARYIQSIRNVLYEHEIEYPTSVGNSRYPVDIEPVTQNNGQLMGSVLSFVILCAINLCTYWHAVCPEIKTKDFKKLPVLVNGDDILFRTDRKKYNNWLETIPQVGLEPSPGKNFISSNYCTVNSQLFAIRNNKTKYIPFYNAGMLLGQSKVARQEVKSKPIYLLHKEVIAGAWSPELADERFKYYNKEKLIKASKHYNGCQLNWYIPNRLGGLGMKLPNTTFVSASRAKEIGSDIEHLAPYKLATDFQSKLANHLKSKWTSIYKTAPMQQFGQESQNEEETKSFKNCIDRIPYFTCIPQDCPRNYWHREKTSEILPPNWSMSAIAFQVDEFTEFYYKPMSYNLKKDKDQRKCDDNLSLLCSTELTEYEIRYPTELGEYVPIATCKDIIPKTKKAEHFHFNPITEENCICGRARLGIDHDDMTSMPFHHSRVCRVNAGHE
jgi:hypothetical protein